MRGRIRPYRPCWVKHPDISRCFLKDVYAKCYVNSCGGDHHRVMHEAFRLVERSLVVLQDLSHEGMQVFLCWQPVNLSSSENLGEHLQAFSTLVQLSV